MGLNSLINTANGNDEIKSSTNISAQRLLIFNKNEKLSVTALKLLEGCIYKTDIWYLGYYRKYESSSN